MLGCECEFNVVGLGCLWDGGKGEWFVNGLFVMWGEKCEVDEDEKVGFMFKVVVSDEV